MSRRAYPVAIAVMVVIALVVLNGAFYTVREGQVAVVTRFGRVIQAHVPPGLHGKIPFTDGVHVFDGRLQTVSLAPQTLLTQGAKRVTVDAYVKWRIRDARQYLAAVGGDREAADARLRETVASALRDTFGRETLRTAVGGPGRAFVRGVNKELTGYGIDVVDVRLVRIGLSTAMIATLEKKMEAVQMARADKIMSRGMEDAQAIRVQADRKRAAILADAYVKAQTIRGTADARAAALYARAYGRHPRFFAFYRSLRAYEKSFANDHTVLILGPDSGLLRYLPIAGR